MSSSIDTVFRVGLTCHDDENQTACLHDVTYMHVQHGRCFGQINGYQIAQLIQDKRWADPSENQIKHFKRFEPRAF